MYLYTVYLIIIRKILTDCIHICALISVEINFSYHVAKQLTFRMYGLYFDYLSTLFDTMNRITSTTVNKIILFSSFSVIHENQMPFMTTWRQEALEQACCYFQPWVVKTPNKEQLVEIRSPQCSFQNFPVWLPSNSLPISATNTSPFPENSFKPPTEAPTEPFIDPSPESSTEPSTEPPIDSATDLSTESSSYYW